MCTLTFVPRKLGYVVAMNRDERLTRPEALPPGIFQIAGTKAVYPHEPGGGTWFASNEHGVCLAILNVGDSSAQKGRSRGELVPALIGYHDLQGVSSGLLRLQLAGMAPFRLVGIFFGERQIREWRWEGRGITERSFAWTAHHWFSSGLSDDRAQQERTPVCRRAWRRVSAGGLAWLRALHRSHRPQRGAFSLCVHRADAATRSYTEVLYRPGRLNMRYTPGNPCSPSAESTVVRLLSSAAQQRVRR